MIQCPSWSWNSDNSDYLASLSFLTHHHRAPKALADRPRIWPPWTSRPLLLRIRIQVPCYRSYIQSCPNSLQAPISTTGLLKNEYRLAVSLFYTFNNHDVFNDAFPTCSVWGSSKSQFYMHQEGTVRRHRSNEDHQAYNIQNLELQMFSLSTDVHSLEMTWLCWLMPALESSLLIMASRLGLSCSRQIAPAVARASSVGVLESLDEQWIGVRWCSYCKSRRLVLVLGSRSGGTREVLERWL